SSWQAFQRFVEEVRQALAAREGRGLLILTGPVSSPFMLELLAQLRRQMPRFQWHIHAPLGGSARREGSMRVFGAALEPVYDLTQAEAILTIDADLCQHVPGHLRYARELASARRERSPEQAPILYTIESTPTLTGARADRRIALPPGEIRSLVDALAAAVLSGTDPEVTGDVAFLARELLRGGARS